jgi:hypothetical protein
MTGTATFSCFGGILSTNDDAGLVGLVGAGDGFSTFLEAYGLDGAGGPYSNGLNAIFGFGLISFIEMTEGLI